MRRSTEQRRQWLEAGLCTACGRPRLAGYRRCHYCVNYYRRTARLYMADKKARGECVQCKARAVDGCRCERHRLEAKVRMGLSRG